MVEIKTTRQPEAGLTLIEISFAILILAGSLVVLLGLQTSSLQLAAHDKSSQRAMLITRRLLAPLETTKEQLQNKVYEGDFLSVLKQLAPYDVDQDESSADSIYSIRLEISDWGIPDLNERAMKQVSLVVAWGTGAQERLESFYFLPFEEGKNTEDEE